MKLPAPLTALLLAGTLTLAVSACGKPSVEASESRFKANKDKISVLITKQPVNKAEFEKKIAEFDKEHTDAMAAGSDEEKIKKLSALNTRMEKYLKEFEAAKPATKTGGAAGASKKLDKTAPATAPKTAPATAPAAGGKLGGGGAAQPASGGMGGGTAQPASGGMGGGGTAAPAKPASGGMGGM